MRLLLILSSLLGLTAGCRVLDTTPGDLALWFLGLFDSNVTFGDGLVYIFCAVTLFAIGVSRS